jgi:Protein of unknown function (DUF664)
MTRGPDERASLNAFLQAQRDSVLAIVDGLDERDMRRPVVGSGWSPLGLIEHLGHAERFWFTQVIGGRTEPREDASVVGPAHDDGSLTTPRPVDEVARHAGHLDIARELLDGRTGLGPR